MVKKHPKKKHAKKHATHHKTEHKEPKKKKPAHHKEEKKHREEEHDTDIDEVAEDTKEQNNDPQTPEESLRYIYELDSDQDKGVDMSKLDIMKTPVVRRVLLATLLVLIAIAAGLVGTVILNNPFATGNESALTFDINTSESGIVSGQKTEITIPYNNPGNVPLADVEIVLHLPDSFILSVAMPEPIEQNPLVWKIGSLDSNENGEIIIEGIFYEKPGTVVTIQTISRYTPSNFSSPFEDIVSRSVMIEESIFQTAIDGPARSIPGETQEYKITVEHTNEEDKAQDAQLRLELPQGFTIESSSVEGSEENLPIWNVSDLEFGEVFELTISGEFASDVQGDQEIVSIVGVQLNGEFIEQARKEFSSKVLASDFSLSLIVNGTTGNSIILPNDDVIVNISLDNRGEEAAETITIELFVDNGLSRLNLSERAGIPNGDVHGNKINWDHTDMGRLETLHGGNDASIDVAIPTNDGGVTTIVLRAEATITSVGGIEINRKIESTTITIQVASDIQATSNAAYFDASGSSVGSGPLPPQVGKETVYRITWSVANALNDVNNLVMVASIPSDSAWGGLVSSTDGNVHYDTVANRVRWSVGNLAEGSSPPIAVFDIKVNPSSASVGTFLDLLGQSSVTAFDTVTGAQVTSSSPALTSELPNDPLAENKGVVIE